MSFKTLSKKHRRAQNGEKPLDVQNVKSYTHANGQFHLKGTVHMRVHTERKPINCDF